VNPRADASAHRARTVDLGEALEQALARHFGVRRAITGLERRPSAYQSSFTLEEVVVRLDNGTVLPLLFKDVSPQALLPAARAAKPEFLYDPLREIETYRIFLEPEPLGTPACYGASVDPPGGRYWLFLESVPGQELYRVGEWATWQHAARWLAGLHGRLAGAVERQAEAAHLLRYQRDYLRLWMSRARACARAAGRSAGDRRGLEWLAGHHDRVVDRLAALPVTFIHGEFYASNVLVQGTGDSARVCPVDWEMAGVGPGLIDLAALTAGAWTEEQKVTLALAYHAALPSAGGWRPDRETFLSALDCCRLQMAVQWLGWSPGWSPPAEHAQDWLTEALTLAEKIGL
jgi:Ser/Thr protein kinase RdoA (MazF antagonist)